MKKLVLFVLMLVAVAYAGVVTPFKQFTENNYEVHSSNQHVTSSSEIKLDIKGKQYTGGMDVWLTNYVDPWESNTGIPALDGNVYNMSSARYGYVFDGDVKNGMTDIEDYWDKIHWGDGTTADITFYKDDDISDKRTGTAYFLGHFDANDQIYLVMTTLPADGDETIDSHQWVQDDKHDTVLVARSLDGLDAAGNVIVNFTTAFNGGEATPRPFVAVYSTSENEVIEPATGGPLPGVFFAGLLSMGTIFGASKMKKQKRA